MRQRSSPERAETNQKGRGLGRAVSAIERGPALDGTA